MAKKSPRAVRDFAVTDLDAIKTHLKLRSNDTSQDDNLEEWIAAAKGKADRYCNNKFEEEDENGNKYTAIPEEVETWIKMYVGWCYARRTGNVKQESVTGLGAVTWKDQEEYDTIAHLRLHPGFGYFI